MRRVAVLALLAAACGAAAPSPDPPGLVRMTDEQQKTVHLQLARAQRQAITEPVRVPGSVAYDPGHVAVLRPFGQARVRRLLVAEGEVVAAGQPMAELDMPGLVTSQRELAAARTAIRVADAGVAVARDSLRRGEILARDGSLARAEAERRRLVLAQAQAEADNARAQAASLQTAVSRLNPAAGSGVATLASPLSGVVVSAGLTPGEFVEATRDAYTVADLSVVLVLAQVPEAGAALVAVNDPVRVTLPAGGGRQWDGRIATLAAAIDPQARTLPARIRLANPDGALRIGMYVDVTVSNPTGRDSVTVPAAAVQMVGDKQVVFTPLGGDRFQGHEVGVGVQRPDMVELRPGITGGTAAGIAAGDQVVTTGSFELKALLQQAMLGGG